jgi:L-malate glycosyltransferase
MDRKFSPPMMWNVLLVIESLAHRGGTETQILELISRVDSTRFRLHVCCFEEGSPPLALPPPHTIQILPLTKVNSLAAIRQILRLRAYIRRNRIDLVQTFMFKASVIGVLAAWSASCRAIVTSRRSLDFACGHDKMTRILNSLSNRILANSETVKSTIAAAEKVSPLRIDVLYNGVDVERFGQLEVSDSKGVFQRLGIPVGAPVVGIIANLRPVKDIPFFLAAAREVAATVRESRFVIIGDGPLKPQLEAYAAELGIREKVLFTGSSGDVAEYLRHITVGCLCSVAEGFSNAILEFMAAGIPVVATAVGGNSEAIVSGVTGYLVEGRSVAEFAGHIITLLVDENNRNAMGRHAQARCRELFDVREMVRRHEEYWLSLIQQESATSSEAAGAGR